MSDTRILNVETRYTNYIPMRTYLLKRYCLKYRVGQLYLEQSGTNIRMNSLYEGELLGKRMEGKAVKTEQPPNWKYRVSEGRASC